MKSAHKHRHGWKVALVLVVLSGIMMPAAWAVNFDGRKADTNYHTFLYSTTSKSTPWHSNMNATRSGDFDPTDLTTGRVYYHYNSGLTYPYVDVSWWVTDLPSPLAGSAGCNKTLSGNRCDHWHVQFDEEGTSEAIRDHLVCHEVGHTVGLEHYNPTGGYSSCMRSTTNMFTNLHSHDTSHINGYY